MPLGVICVKRCISERFNFYTALSLHMNLLLWFFVGLVSGFFTVRLITPDPKDTVVYIEDEEAFQRACYEGMRRGIR